MDFISIETAKIWHIETTEDEFNKYTRHSAGCWTVTMGESEEMVYDCEELEAKFQEWMLKHHKGIIE